MENNHSHASVNGYDFETNTSHDPDRARIIRGAKTEFVCRLQNPVRQRLMTLLLSSFASLWVIFTIIFAWNCTLQNPFSPGMIFSAPSTTVLTLNILSHGTVVLLRELTSSVFEIVRWALACTPHGVSLPSFISLSRATGPLGVLSFLSANHFNDRLWATLR